MKAVYLCILIFYLPYEISAQMQSLDSTLKKNLGYGIGKYWNIIWSRYYALDEFKGLRSIRDPNIVHYNLYSRDFPLVLINEIPLVFYDIGSVEFKKINSASYVDTFSKGVKKIYPFLDKGILSIKAEIQRLQPKFSSLNIEYDMREYTETSKMGLNSILDSVLLLNVGFTLNQCYNNSIYRMFQRWALGSNSIPLLDPNLLKGDIFNPPLITKNDTLYSLYINHFPFNFLDGKSWKTSRLQTGVVTAVKRDIEKMADSNLKIPLIIKIDIIVE